jgi:hypothetical protein
LYLEENSIIPQGAGSFAMVAFFVIALGEQHEARHILPKISPIQ